jgi:trans-aconitate methyltransferase
MNVNEKPKETWGAGEQYERYVGRWSRLVAREFLAWLSVPAGERWVDVGCGTGGLAGEILRAHAPREVIGVDRSAGFLALARHTLTDPRVRFEAGDALDLPLESDIGDVTVSGLVLNFVPDYTAMVKEMIRVTKPGGKVAAYVWDYAGGMQMMRYFWDAAVAIDTQAAQLDQGERFPLCQPQPLNDLFQGLGLTAVSVRAIEIETIFQDFEDYWIPFLGGQGSAPTYLATVDEETREQIRQRLQARLTPQADGTIALTARAWAVQGVIELR